jgi:hypothetical protein
LYFVTLLGFFFFFTRDKSSHLQALRKEVLDRK